MFLYAVKCCRHSCPYDLDRVALEGCNQTTLYLMTSFVLKGISDRNNSLYACSDSTFELSKPQQCLSSCYQHPVNETESPYQRGHVANTPTAAGRLVNQELLMMEVIYWSTLNVMELLCNSIKKWTNSIIESLN